MDGLFREGEGNSGDGKYQGRDTCDEGQDMTTGVVIAGISEIYNVN